jgi:hypothetical protein
MKLYFNGCSHTHGDDLEHPEISAWPAVFAKMLGCDFVNYAVSGNSNDRIKYQTIKHYADFDKFYIAWTYTSRFTRYRGDNNYVVNFNPNLKNKHYGDTAEFQQYGKLHYSFWFNELYAFKIWLQDIILLQRFFESIKKPYVMINSENNLINRWTVDWKDFNNSVKLLLCFDHMNDEQLYQEHTEIQNLLKQINFSHYIGWNAWWLTKFNLEYPTGPTQHLLEQGHRAIAEYILKYDTNS